MSIRSALGGVLAGLVVAVPAQAGDSHYQQLLSTYNELVTLRQSLESTPMLPGPQGPQGPAGPTGPQGEAGPAGGTSLTSEERHQVKASLESLYDEMDTSARWYEGTLESAQTLQRRGQAMEKLFTELEATAATLEAEAGQ